MDWVANLEGPVFLGLYAAFILVALLAAYLAVRASPGGDKTEPRAPVLPNPYEMAYLRGGELEIGKLVLLDLARRGYIQERGGSSMGGEDAYLLRADNHPSPDELSGPQLRILETIGVEDKPVSKLLTSRRFQAAIEEIKQGFVPRLHREGLIVGDFKRAKALFVSALLITGLGGYRLAISLANGDTNVGFLLLFAAASMFALWTIASARRTWRGDKHFHNTQEAYRYETGGFDAVAAQSGEMLLHVGLFGAPISIGTSGAAYAAMLGLAPSRRRA